MLTVEYDKSTKTTVSPLYLRVIVPIARDAEISRRDMLNILYQNNPSQTHDTALHKPRLNQADLIILTAHVLRYPIEICRPLDQVGRFIRVAYEPVTGCDPDVIVAVARDTRPFHHAMLHFLDQRFRRNYSRADWAEWYENVMDAARNLIEPLRALNAHPQEAAFVLRWAALIASTGNNDGHRAT